MKNGQALPKVERVDFFRWDENSEDEYKKLMQWVESDPASHQTKFFSFTPQTGLHLFTPDATLWITPGQYIVRGAKGLPYYSECSKFESKYTILHT